MVLHEQDVVHKMENQHARLDMWARDVDKTVDYLQVKSKNCESVEESQQK